MKRNSRDKDETDADSVEIDLARIASRREIDERQRGFPMETHIWRGFVSLDAIFSVPSAFPPIIRILLVINMEMFYVASVVYSARINSNPPYKYSSLHVEYYVIFIYVFYQIFYILKFLPIRAGILNKVFVYCSKPGLTFRVVEHELYRNMDW